MGRTEILTVMLAAVVSVAMAPRRATLTEPGTPQRAGAAPFPVLAISVYAPRQDAPPVHIIGLQNDKQELRLVLLNKSDRAVAGVDVDIVDIAPGACAVKPEIEAEDGEYGFSEGEFPVHLAPHTSGVAPGLGTVMTGSATASTAPAHLPERMVYVARTAGSAYMQVQLGVVAVYFEDGSTWPADWSAAGHPPSHPYAFDPLLIKAEGDKCADAAAVAAVATAMKSVKDVAFAEQEPQALEPKDRTVLPPHLRFSCRLEGPKAICRMPLETDRRGPQPAARAAERN